MKLRIDSRFFNRAYWVLCHAAARFVVLRGGSNSSKSWSNYQHLVLWLLKGDQNAIVFRKSGSTLRNSVFENLKLVAKQLQVFHLFDYYYSGDKREIVSKLKGNRIILSGLDEPDKLKSIVGITRIIMEEADQYEEKDFRELVRRFRGQKGIQFIFIFNPVSDTHWIKKVLFDTKAYSERSEHHLFTIDDNRFATKEDYEELEALKDIDENEYQIYRWGAWGTIRAKNPYLLHLSRKVNSRKLTDNEFESIYLAFDFNVQNSVTVWQKWHDYDGWHVHCLREIRMGGTPDTDLEAICKLLAEDYRERELIVTGDSSGNNRSALTEGNAEAFKLVYRYLLKHGAEFVTYNRLQSNPRRKKSRFVMNAITKELGENFAIDESCTQFWADIVSIPCDASGDLDKQYCDKMDIGHIMDTGRYFVWANCFDIWLEIQEHISVPKEYRGDDNNVKNNAYAE